MENSPWDASEIEAAMNAHRPTTRRNSYAAIARRWIRDNAAMLSAMAYRRNDLPLGEREFCVPLHELRMAFGHSYVDADGISRPWFHWLSERFPLWDVSVRGYSGSNRRDMKGFHSVVRMRRGVAESAAETLRESAPHAMHGTYLRGIEAAASRMRRCAAPRERFSVERQPLRLDGVAEWAEGAPDSATREKARRMLAFSHPDGWLPVIERVSASGRVYHRRLNLQTASKGFRSAALGPHLKADAKVCSWRFVQRELGRAGVPLPAALSEMLDDRAAFREAVARDVCGGTDAQSLGRVKKAITSIPFGVGLRNPETSGLRAILGGAEAAGRFIADPRIRELAEMRSLLRKRFRERARAGRRSLPGNLFRPGGVPRVRKVLSHFYNLYETEVRRRMTALAEAEFGTGCVLLQLHDGLCVGFGDMDPAEAERAARRLFSPERFADVGPDQEFDVRIVMPESPPGVSRHYPAAFRLNTEDGPGGDGVGEDTEQEEAARVHRGA